MNVREAGIEADKIIVKIDRFGADIREAKRTAANTTRTFVDKDSVDYSKVEKTLSKTEMFKKPWECKSKLFTVVELRLDATIDNLTRDVEIKKKSSKVSSSVIIPMVAEKMEYQYSSDVFETFQKGLRNMEIANQRNDLVPNKDDMRR